CARTSRVPTVSDTSALGSRRVLEGLHQRHPDGRRAVAALLHFGILPNWKLRRNGTPLTARPTHGQKQSCSGTAQSLPQPTLSVVAFLLPHRTCASYTQFPFPWYDYARNILKPQSHLRMQEGVNSHGQFYATG